MTLLLIKIYQKTNTARQQKQIQAVERYQLLIMFTRNL